MLNTLHAIFFIIMNKQNNLFLNKITCTYIICSNQIYFKEFVHDKKIKYEKYEIDVMFL